MIGRKRETRELIIVFGDQRHEPRLQAFFRAGGECLRIGIRSGDTHLSDRKIRSDDRIFFGRKRILLHQPSEGY